MQNLAIANPAGKRVPGRLREVRTVFFDLSHRANRSCSTTIQCVPRCTFRRDARCVLRAAFRIARNILAHARSVRGGLAHANRWDRSRVGRVVSALHSEILEPSRSYPIRGWVSHKMETGSAHRRVPNRPTVRFGSVPLPRSTGRRASADWERSARFGRCFQEPFAVRKLWTLVKELSLNWRLFSVVVPVVYMEALFLIGREIVPDRPTDAFPIGRWIVPNRPSAVPLALVR